MEANLLERVENFSFWSNNRNTIKKEIGIDCGELSGVFQFDKGCVIGSKYWEGDNSLHNYLIYTINPYIIWRRE